MFFFSTVWLRCAHFQFSSFLLACPPERFGADCSGSCNHLGKHDCVGIKIAAPGNRLQCARGYHGLKCDESKLEKDSVFPFKKCTQIFSRTLKIYPNRSIFLHQDVKLDSMDRTVSWNVAIVQEKPVTGIQDCVTVLAWQGMEAHLVTQASARHIYLASWITKNHTHFYKSIQSFCRNRRILPTVHICYRL